MINRKILSLVLIAVLAFSLTACGSADTSDASSAEPAAETSAPAAEAADSSAAEGSAVGQIAALLEQGYTRGCVSSSDGKTVVVDYASADHTEFRQAVCTMTSEQLDAFFAIDFMAEDYDQQVMDALAECPDLEIITPTLPDMSEYDCYIGQTIGDMEDAGFDIAGCSDDDDGNMVVIIYACLDDYTSYTFHVYPEEDTDDMIYDDDAIRALTVGQIVFWDFD